MTGTAARKGCRIYQLYDVNFRIWSSLKRRVDIDLGELALHWMYSLSKLHHILSCMSTMCATIFLYVHVSAAGCSAWFAYYTSTSSNGIGWGKMMSASACNSAAHDASRLCITRYASRATWCSRDNTKQSLWNTQMIGRSSGICVLIVGAQSSLPNPVIASECRGPIRMQVIKLRAVKSSLLA